MEHKKALIILLEEIAYTLYQLETWQKRWHENYEMRPLPKDQYLGELYSSKR